VKKSSYLELKIPQYLDDIREVRRILLVEDEADQQLYAKKILGTQFQVICASSAAEAYQALRQQSFDLILLDIGLPEVDGFKFLSQLRAEDETKTIPVIFLSGKTDPSDKVMGFSLGADDYIVKPFEPREFRARVEARLKRHQENAEEDNHVIKGVLRFVLSKQRAHLIADKSETELGLTPNEFKILYLLASREGQVFSRAQLLDHAWGRGVHVLDRTVDRHISSLREKLGDYSHYIESVHGEGYRFSLEKKSSKTRQSLDKSVA
jgi:DNA-binding response OmpR family regulator